MQARELVDLNSAIRDSILGGNKEGVMQCFSYSVNPTSLLHWMYNNKEYEFLESVLCRLENRAIKTLHDKLVKIYLQCLYSERKDLVDVILQYIILEQCTVSFLCGKLDYKTDKLGAQFCVLPEYYEGLIRGGHLALFKEVFAPSEEFTLKQAAFEIGFSQRKNFMDFLGYEKEMVEQYIQGLLSKAGAKPVLADELAAIYDMKKFFSKTLNECLRYCYVDLDRCLWYIRNGAQVSEDTLLFLKTNKKEIYEKLFVCDV